MGSRFPMAVTINSLRVSCGGLIYQPDQDWIWWSARPDWSKSGFADVTDGWKSIRAGDFNEIER